MSSKFIHFISKIMKEEGDPIDIAMKNGCSKNLVDFVKFKPVSERKNHFSFPAIIAEMRSHNASERDIMTICGKDVGPYIDPKRFKEVTAIPELMDTTRDPITTEYAKLGNVLETIRINNKNIKFIDPRKAIEVAKLIKLLLARKVTPEMIRKVVLNNG